MENSKNLKKYAAVLTRVFSPITSVLIGTYLIYLKHIPKTNIDALKWFGICSIVFVIAPVTILIFLKLKLISDLDVTNRKQRPVLFTIFLGLFWAIYLITLRAGYPEAASLLFFAAISFGTVVLITLFWKISIHTFSVTLTCCLIVSNVQQPWTIALLSIPFITAWTRTLLAKHTKKQALGGIMHAAALVLIWHILNTQ